MGTFVETEINMKEIVERLQSFIESEGKFCSFDPELITPESVYRMWEEQWPSKRLKKAHSLFKNKL